MTIAPDQLLRMLHSSRTESHENIDSVASESEPVQQPQGSCGVRGGNHTEWYQIERCLSQLKVLGLSHIASIFSWSIIPMAPLLSHLGVVIFGREIEEQPVWWQVISSPKMLAWLSNRLYEE